MIQDLLALSWGTIFMFGIKAISAWAVATLCVVLPLLIPIAVLKALVDD